MKKLYLRSVRLNNCKGLTELYELVKKEGGYHYEMVANPERRGTYKKLELVEVSENA